MAVIKVAKLPEKKISALALLAELCYYYPQYTLADARRLPAVHVYLLMRTARKMKAQEYYQFTQIAAAPHTKNGTGVKSLAEQFRSMAK